MSKEIKWSGYNWLTQERWGQIHPNKPVVWYDDTAISIDDRTEYLHLFCHYNPKYFPHIDVKCDIGTGMISCKEKFDYGYFEIEAKLPEGKHQWPAFWMWSFSSWPPEIDVLEAYTRKRNGYFSLNWKNLLGFWNVNTNIHLGKYPDNYNSGAKTHWMGFKNPAKNFIKYGCRWEPDRIEIYYNERLVRKITDEDILKQFRGHKMNIIINNSRDGNVTPDHLLPQIEENNFIIKYFKYEPY